MIEGLANWELLKTIEVAIKGQAAISLKINLSQSSLVFVLYLLTSKRTAIMGLSFFCCEVSGWFFGFGLYQQDFHIYIGYLLITCYFAIIQLDKSRDKDLAFWCLLLIMTFLYAAYDAYTYGEVKTGFYLAYPSIVLYIHVCIILSFYKPHELLKRLVIKLHGFIAMLRSNYTFQYICYNIQHKHKQRD